MSIHEQGFRSNDSNRFIDDKRTSVINGNNMDSAKMIEWAVKNSISLKKQIKVDKNPSRVTLSIFPKSLQLNNKVIEAKSHTINDGDTSCHLLNSNGECFTFNKTLFFGICGFFKSKIQFFLHFVIFIKQSIRDHRLE